MEQNHFTCSAAWWWLSRTPFHFIITLPAAAAERIKIYNIALDARGWENNLFLEQWSGKKSFSLSRWSLWERFCSPYTCHTKGITPAPSLHNIWAKPSRCIWEFSIQHQVASWINVKREIVKTIKIGSAPVHKAKENVLIQRHANKMWKQ
jgi:hypothetical protein